MVIQTDRLILRTWSEEDAQSYFELNQDPKVFEFLPGPLRMEAVKQFIAAKNRAIEEKISGELMGFIGLHAPSWEAHFTPCVEIGWRLGSQYWGKGYATEGAKAVLWYAFDHLGLEEIVSFTVPENVRSIRVMERIGMKRDFEGDFVHPMLSPDHRLSKHVLYRLKVG